MRTHWTIIVASWLVAAGCTKQGASSHNNQPADPPAPAAPTKTAPPPTATGLDTARIEKLTGAKGTLNEKEGAFKVSVPRKDLAVTVAGSVKMTPPMGLTAWASFQKGPEHDM